jgi:hypothetical protein
MLKSLDIELIKKAGFEVIGYDAYKGVYEKAEAAGITMVDFLLMMNCRSSFKIPIH